MTSTEFKTHDKYSIEFPEIFHIPSFIAKNIQGISWYAEDGWNNIEIGLYNAIKPSTVKSLYNLIEWYNLQPKELNKPIFSFKIFEFDSVGAIIDTWEISVKKIINIDFGYLDYSANESNDCKLYIEPFSVKLIN